MLQAQAFATVLSSSSGRTLRPIAAKYRLRLAYILGASACWIALLPPGTVAAQNPTLDQMQALIAAQQKQIELQQQQIEAQRRALEKLQTDVTAMQKVAPVAGGTAAGAAVAGTTATAPAKEGPPEVTSGVPRVQLSISGQVNKMINVVNDGEGTDTFFVDNQNSTSRVRFVGTGRISPDLTIGSRIELGIRPNSSNLVSQDDQDAGDSFDQRVVEAFVEDKTYGRVLLGKGSTAADNAHEVDLSGTDVATYAAISDLAGGMQFRNSAGALTGITFAEAFTDFDGSRRDRLRYDSPVFSGFTLSGAMISDERWDSALFWTGQNETWKAGAAAAFQQPNLSGVDYRYGGSFSVLHKPTGLNLTASAGSDARVDNDAYNFFVKAGWQERFWDIGLTSFSLDYTYSGSALLNGASVRGDGQSVGLYAVQNLAEYGVDFYGGLRWLTVNPDTSLDLQDMTIFSMGTRVKF